MPSNHLILCHHLLLRPSIFPNIRVFSNELVPVCSVSKLQIFDTVLIASVPTLTTRSAELMPLITESLYPLRNTPSPISSTSQSLETGPLLSVSMSWTSGTSWFVRLCGVCLSLSAGCHSAQRPRAHPCWCQRQGPLSLGWIASSGTCSASLVHSFRCRLSCLPAPVSVDQAARNMEPATLRSWLHLLQINTRKWGGRFDCRGPPPMLFSTVVAPACVHTHTARVPLLRLFLTFWCCPSWQVGSVSHRGSDSHFSDD